jgi:ABC-2 type transport system permease protein
MTTRAATPVEGAYRVTGPSALSGDWRRFMHLSLTLAVTDFKLRFFGSVLGYLWSLVRPLLMFGVLYLVFSEVFRFGGEVRYYPVILLMAIVVYEYFTEATGNSVMSVIDRENLVRKIHFPRMAIPLSITLTAAFNLGLNFIVVVFFMAISGIEPRWSWLGVLPLVALLVAFATGIAMLLSALFVQYRDVSPIWDVFLRALFYATPIIYPIEQLASRNETLAHVAMCNPLAAIIEQLRHMVIDPTAPSAAEAIGGAPMLLIPLAILVGSCALGFWVFNRMAPQIAERL